MNNRKYHTDPVMLLAQGQAIMSPSDQALQLLALNPAPERKKFAIVLDNASWHMKTIRLVETEMLPEYSETRESVASVKLPPCSPDFNPVEQVWRITRWETFM